MIAGENVVPAPYIIVEQTISKVLDNKSTMAPSLASLDEVQSNDLRLLGYYFPSMLNLCINDENIKVILANGFVRFWFFLIVTVVAVWQVSLNYEIDTQFT